MSGLTPEQRNLEGRFVEWFLGEYDIDPAGDDWRHLTEALHALAAAPSDDDLGAAWHEAEEALPESDPPWMLTLHTYIVEATREPFVEATAAAPMYESAVQEFGPTPAAALRALAARLREAT